MMLTRKGEEMNILFLTNNDISLSLTKWLEQNGENIVICRHKINLEYVDNVNPDLVISYNYGYIIKKDIINRMKEKIINLHISLLPWNRGSCPNFWSFIENTPIGVSIIIVDEGIDTGKILFNKEVKLNEENETFYTSYLKLHEEIQEIFKKNWDNIREWNIKPVEQIGKGSLHYDKDYNELIRKIDDFNWDMNIKEFKERYSEILINY